MRAVWLIASRSVLVKRCFYTGLMRCSLPLFSGAQPCLHGEKCCQWRMIYSASIKCIQLTNKCLLICQLIAEPSTRGNYWEWIFVQSKIDPCKTPFRMGLTEYAHPIFTVTGHLPHQSKHIEVGLFFAVDYVFPLHLQAICIGVGPSWVDGGYIKLIRMFT